MMSFAANLVKARSHIAIIAGLVTASALIVIIETNDPGTLALRTLSSSSLDGETRRAAAYAWAQIPESERTPEMQQVAARLGLRDDAPGALGPEEAKALLRTLVVKDAVLKSGER